MEGNCLMQSSKFKEKKNYHDYQQQQHYQQESQHWMTPEISAQVQACSQLRKTAETTGKQEDHEAYQALCRKVHGMIEESKINLGIGQLPALPQGYGWHQQSGYGYNSYHSRGQWANSNYHHPSGNQYQGDQKKQFTCKPCNRSYFSQRKLDEHVQEHVDCPFPECKMSAHMRVIDQHINNQHMLVNFAELQIDDETWVAERKKRFPSTQRAQVRRAEQMEKLKRGENLGISKKPFKGKIKSIISNNDNKERNRCYGNKKENIIEDTEEKGKELYQCAKNTKGINRACGNTGTTDVEKKRENTEVKRKGERREKFKRQRQQQHSLENGPPIAIVAVDLFESDDERDGLQAFKGTKSFYEEIGEVSYFGSKVMDESEDEALDHEENIAISDDEEWEIEKKTEATPEPFLLGGALGSLMGAYTDSEDENMENGKPQCLLKSSNGDASSPNISVDIPVDIPKIKDTEEKGECVIKTTRKKIGRKGRGHLKGPPKPHRAAHRRRKTLLEKLLQSDIIHERNVILQCVRFIVGNDFFCDEKNNDIQEKSDNEEQIVDNKGVESKLMKLEGHTSANKEHHPKETSKGQKVEESVKDSNIAKRKDVTNKQAAKRLKKELLAGDQSSKLSGNEYSRENNESENSEMTIEKVKLKSIRNVLNGHMEGHICNTDMERNDMITYEEEKEIINKENDREKDNCLNNVILLNFSENNEEIVNCLESKENNLVQIHSSRNMNAVNETEESYNDLDKINCLEEENKTGVSEKMLDSSASKRKNCEKNKITHLGDEENGEVKRIKLNDVGNAENNREKSK